MIDLDFINIDEEKIRKIKEKEIKRIYNDENMRVFIEENKIPRSFVYDHLSNFIKVLDCKKDCENCQSLRTCSKNGYYYDLSVNLRLNKADIKFKQCEKIKKRDKIKYKFIICNTDPSFFDYELKDCSSHFKEDRKLALVNMAKIIKENLNDGLYIYGEKGIGKSFLLSVFAKHLVSRRAGHFVYVDLRILIPSLLEASFKDKESFNEDIELLKTVDYLFIDNFGEEDKNDFSKGSIILEVLKYRQENNLPTYIASIYSMKELYSIYRTPKTGNFKTGEIVSIIESTCKVVNIPTTSKIASSIF